MRREAIGDGAIGAAGQKMLTTDFGRTRLVEILKAIGDPGAAVGRDGTHATRRDGIAAATRP